MAETAFFPRVHATIVCDGIEYLAGDEGQYNLLGVRTRITPTRYPYSHPRLCVYLQISGRSGTVSVNLKVVEAATDSVTAVTPERRIDLMGPLMLLPSEWHIDRCRFPRPGLYYIQVEVGSKLINERLLVLTSATGATNGESNH